MSHSFPLKDINKAFEQQIVDTFPDDTASAYLLRDRDSISTLTPSANA